MSIVLKPMTRVSFDIIPYSEGLLSAYTRLIPRQQQVVEVGKIAWKLRDHPVGPGVVAVCRSAEGEVLGMTAFQSTRFIDGNDKLLLGHQAMDTAAATDANVPGLTLRLVQTFYDRTDTACVFGFPNEKSGTFFFGRLQWKRLGVTPIVWRPLRSGFLSRRFLGRGIDLPLPRLSMRRPRRKAVVRLSGFDDSHSAAWATLRKLQTPKIAVDRSPEILNWRFVTNPAFKYDLWAVGHEAIAVSRIQETHGERVLQICELMGSVDDMAELVDAVIAHNAHQRPDYAMAWAIGGTPVHTALREAGFFDLPERIRRNKVYFGARGAGGDRSAVPDLCDWHLTLFDSEST
jgi:hypothetical protein